MDNVVVGATGAVCFLMAQASTNWFESFTPLGIVALVVYFFLFKFDKKMDIIEEKTSKIDQKIDSLILKGKENESEQNQ